MIRNSMAITSLLLISGNDQTLLYSTVEPRGSHTCSRDQTGQSRPLCSSPRAALPASPQAVPPYPVLPCVSSPYGHKLVEPRLGRLLPHTER